MTHAASTLAAGFGAIAIALAGCAGLPNFASLQAPSQKSLYEIRAGYDATFLAPAANYRELPDCAGAQFTLTLPCSDAAVVAKLRQADARAAAALEAAQAFALAHPGDLGLQGLIDAANAAVAQAAAILRPYLSK